MAYAPHLLLAFGGPLGATEESWTCTLRITNPAEIGESDLDFCKGQVADAAADCLQLLGDADVGSQAKLAFVKLNPIGSDGKYRFQETVQEDLTPAQSGAGTSLSNHAFQVAACVTWRTALERGRAAKGRMFLPVPHAVVDSNGVMSSTWANTAAAAAAQFIANINNWDGVDPSEGNAAVFSSIGEPLPTDEGPFNVITHAQVGRVPDTQRRRRRSLQESYQAPVPLP